MIRFRIRALPRWLCWRWPQACWPPPRSRRPLPPPAITDPGPLGYGVSDGLAINAGQIGGGCDSASSDQHAVLWQNGTATGLGTFGGPQASAAAINNLGQVAGWAQTSTGADHGSLYSNGR